MTFMGTLDIHNGRWGAFTDVAYVDIGANKSQARDFAVDGVSEPHGRPEPGHQAHRWTWRPVPHPNQRSGLHGRPAGRRAHAQHQEHPGLVVHGRGGVAPIGGPQRLTVVKDTLWDAIVGVKGTYTFGAERQWFVPYYFDIGTGQSSLTYQIAGGIGYKYKWGDRGRNVALHRLQHEVGQSHRKCELQRPDDRCHLALVSPASEAKKGLTRRNDALIGAGDPHEIRPSASLEKWFDLPPWPA
jgi:hypothetical protein